MKILKNFVVFSLICVLSVCLFSACGTANTPTADPQTDAQASSVPVLEAPKNNSEAAAIVEAFSALPDPSAITNADEFTEGFTTFTDLYVQVVDLSLANPDDATTNDIMTQITNCSSLWINKSYDFESFETEDQAKRFFETYEANQAKIQESLEKLLAQ